MSDKHLGPAGDPVEGSREKIDQNLAKQSATRDGEKATPKTPDREEGDTGGGKHPPVKSETGA